MRIILCVLLFCFSAEAQAQFWKKKQKRQPPIAQVKRNSLDMSPRTAVYPIPQMNFQVVINRDEYAYYLAETSVMKSLKNSMRYRKLDNMRDEFEQLSEIYMKQGRFSEAKWYLLQSYDISKGKKDIQGIVNSLISLAVVKLAIGDFAMARQDLLEAKELSSTNGLFLKLLEIEKQIQQLHFKKVALVSTLHAVPQVGSF